MLLDCFEFRYIVIVLSQNKPLFLKCMQSLVHWCFGRGGGNDTILFEAMEKHMDGVPFWVTVNVPKQGGLQWR